MSESKNVDSQRAREWLGATGKFILAGLISVAIVLMVRKELPGLYAGAIAEGMYAIIKFLTIVGVLLIPIFYFTKIVTNVIAQFVKSLFSSSDNAIVQQDKVPEFSIKLSSHSKAQWKIVLTRIIELLTSQDSSDTKNIFIDGKWGSGKTTFITYLHGALKRIPAILKNDPEIQDILKPLDAHTWTVINFDPWVLHVEDDPTHSLLKKLIQHPDLADLKIQGELKELLNILTGTSGVLGNLLPVLKHLIKSPLAIIGQIKSKLTPNHKILIVVDNLERCSQSQIERVVTLVNLFNPLHESLRFIVTGNQYLIEQQVANYLGISDKIKTFDDTNYIEKLFHIIPLFYNDEIAADYMVEILQNDTTWTWRNESSVLKSQLLMPFFAGFGRVNRRICQTLCKELIKNVNRIMHSLRGALITGSENEQETARIVEKFVFKLILMKHMQPQLIPELKRNSGVYGSNFHCQSSNPFPSNTEALKNHDNEISRNYLCEGIKSLTNQPLGNKLGEGLGSLGTARLCLVVKAFEEAYPHEG